MMDRAISTEQFAPDPELGIDLDNFSVEFDIPDWQEPYVPSVALQSDHNSSESLSSSDLSCIMPTTLPDLSPAEDRALFNHFINVVAPSLSRMSSQNTNPYLTNFMPLAFANEIVLNSILALSAMHWRKCQPQLALRGSLHQSNATQSLAELLSSIDRASADLALVSSLILCMTELFDGSSTSWNFHLQGAKRLLVAPKTQGPGVDTSTHHTFLKRLYQFLDSAATTSTCRPPMLKDSPGEETTIEPFSSDGEQDFDTPDPCPEDSAVYGIPKQLFHLLDRVNTLAYKRRFRVDEASEANFRNEARKTEHLIDSWCYEYGSVTKAVEVLCPGSIDAQYAVTAFEWALRLRLHQIVEGYSLESAIVSDAVTNILESIQKVRFGSPLESSLLYPLVMAGGACDSFEHRLIIQDRLMVMERTCGFGYVYKARDLVERVWKRREKSVQGAIVNWARIRFEEIDGLVLL